MLGLELKRNLKIVLGAFSLLCMFLVFYYYYAIVSHVALAKTAASALKVGVSSILSRLNDISRISLTETILMAVFFISLIIAVNSLLNLYFLEKRNALVDELTGLYNRKAMKSWLKREISRAERFHHPLSVAMIDLDHFKVYNDKNGHLRGDWLLKTISKLLKESVRDIDFVGRYGGEEFIIVLPHTDHDGSVKVAERIREMIENTNFPGGETQPKGRVTLSMGLVTFSKDFEEEEMIHRADELLYQAKSHGRNMLVHKKYN